MFNFSVKSFALALPLENSPSENGNNIRSLYYMPHLVAARSTPLLIKTASIILILQVICDVISIAQCL